jgi:CheY-like chemotaxis protein
MTLPISPAGGRTGGLRVETPRITRRGGPGLQVLVVDDEPEVCAELAELLDRRGLPALTAPTGEAALRILAARPDVATLVTDIRLGGMDGLALAERAIAGRDPAEALEVVLVTGTVTARQTRTARGLSAFGLMEKPIRGADIAALVGQALDRAASRRDAAGPAGTTDVLAEVAAMEAGELRPRLAPVSAHGLLGAIAGAVARLGLGCARRLTLQPDAAPAFVLDAPRLARALALPAARAAEDLGGAARAELSVDAEAGGARVELAILSLQAAPAPAAPTPDPALPLSVARRMAALQGGRLTAWPVAGGGLRLRLQLGRA